MKTEVYGSCMQAFITTLITHKNISMGLFFFLFFSQKIYIIFSVKGHHGYVLHRRKAKGIEERDREKQLPKKVEMTLNE